MEPGSASDKRTKVAGIRALHVGTSARGGAGLAQIRISAAIEARGQEGFEVACDNFFAKEATHGAALDYNARRLCRRVAVGLNRIWSRKIPLILGSSDLRTVAQYHSGLADAINRSDYDLVHLHWVGDEALSIEEIGQIEKPIVWTFHDMWPLGGAQHYPSTLHPTLYTRRSKNAGPLNQSGLKSWVLRSIDNSVINRKKRHWRKQLTVVSPSQWLLDHIKEDDVFSEMPQARIPNPISIRALNDPTKFKMPEGDQVDSLILLFVSSSGITDPRKGWRLLGPTLSVLKDFLPLELAEKLQLIVVGPGNPPDEFRGIPVNGVGELDQDQLTEVYQNASLTLAPSIFDNFPNVALESMACGTPVIGSRNTGIAEIVTHGLDGGLVDWDSPNHAGEFIGKLLVDQDQLAELGRNCLLKVAEEFSDKAVGGAYLRLYLKSLNFGRV